MRTLRALCLLLPMLLASCGSNHDRMEAELTALRAEVAEMRARDQDRGEAVELLQNRILVLEVGTAAGAPGSAGAAPPAPTLRVVTLAPEEEPEPDLGPVEGDLPEIHAVGSPGRARPERRPTLALAGVPRRPAFAPPPPPPSAPGHDSLGVVPLGGGDAAVAPPAPEPARSAVDAAAQLVRSGRRDEAISSLRSFLRESPGHAQAAAAQMMLAECLVATGRHLDAIGELERLRRRTPGHRPAEVLLAMGLAYAALGDRERARDILFEVVQRHPGSAAARRATERVAELEARRREESTR